MQGFLTYTARIHNRPTSGSWASISAGVREPFLVYRGRA
jgi:hypothetical protein